MISRLSTTKVATVLGATAVGALLCGGVATATPAETVVNTPCSFSQIVAATYAQDEEEGAALAASPMAGSFAAFLAAPAWQRQAILASQPAIVDRVNAFFGGPGSGLARTVFASCVDY